MINAVKEAVVQKLTVNQNQLQQFQVLTMLRLAYQVITVSVLIHTLWYQPSQENISLTQKLMARDG